MIIYYKNCKIECAREKTSSDEFLYYSIIDPNGYEIDCDYSHSRESVRSFMQSLKTIVDDYIKHPEYYKEEN